MSDASYINEVRHCEQPPSHRPNRYPPSRLLASHSPLLAVPDRRVRGRRRPGGGLCPLECHMWLSNDPSPPVRQTEHAALRSPSQSHSPRIVNEERSCADDSPYVLSKSYTLVPLGRRTVRYLDACASDRRNLSWRTLRNRKVDAPRHGGGRLGQARPEAPSANTAARPRRRDGRLHRSSDWCSRSGNLEEPLTFTSQPGYLTGAPESR